MDQASPPLKGQRVQSQRQAPATVSRAGCRHWHALPRSWQPPPAGTPHCQAGSRTHPRTQSDTRGVHGARCRATALRYLAPEIPASAASYPIVQQSKLALATAAASAASALRQLETHLRSGPAGGSRAGGMGVQEMAGQLAALQRAQEQQVALLWQRVVEWPEDQYEPLHR